jgi:hypothetical protein
MSSAFITLFPLNSDTKSAAQTDKKIAYNIYYMQVLYANFYGGIQAQKGRKYHLKIGIKPYGY